jgi:ArsR family transcriptional regulator
MADLFDVLADGTRRAILGLLLDRARGGGPGAEVKVGELVTALDQSQPTVSKHLKVLRDNGLVAVREEGQNRLYRLDPEPLEQVADWLGPFLARAEAAPSDAQQRAQRDAVPTLFAAWAGADAGDRLGRAAAETAHSARVALEAAQEKLQGAQQRVAEKLPHLPRR